MEHFEAGGTVSIMNSKIYLRKISYNYFLLLLTFCPPFFRKFFFVSSERDIHRTTSPTTLRHWICQKHSNHGDQHQQNQIRCPSQLELLSKRFSSTPCLKFRGGNDNRNLIYSSPTKVISDAILFIYPLRCVLAKNAPVCHTR